jgi:hypothetical protein
MVTPIPSERGWSERARLHPIPAESHTVAFGVTRVVDEESTVRYGSARYSVPHQLVGERVWVRVDGEEFVVAHVGPAGAREAAAIGSRRPATRGSTPPTIRNA